MALKLAAIVSQSDMYPLNRNNILDQLARFFLDSVVDAGLRDIVDVCIFARRTTKPMLSDLFPDEDAHQVFEQLRSMPFIERREDGLHIHNSIRVPLREVLIGANNRHVQEIKRRLFSHLQKNEDNGHWANTSDAIHLLNDGIVRRAFYPVDASPCNVEDADSGNLKLISKITQDHDGIESEECLNYAWKRDPNGFHIVRRTSGDITGYYCAIETKEIDDEWRDQDPLIASWMRDYDERAQKGDVALLVRRWLSKSSGEMPSTEQSACWLDLKRTYLELAPALRYVYVAVKDPAPYSESLVLLGFELLPKTDFYLDGTPYTTALLDLGPNSSKGWILQLLRNEIESPSNISLNENNRELRLENGTVARLTKRETDVASILLDAAGATVSRKELLDAVWGIDYEGGSNVVDAIVKSLRKKFGDSSDRLATVWGVGYRIIPALLMISSYFHHDLLLHSL
jgi:DNA-binding winged helix-turn-helix (wHTH) protein